MDLLLEFGDSFRQFGDLAAPYDGVYGLRLKFCRVTAELDKLLLGLCELPPQLSVGRKPGPCTFLCCSTLRRRASK